MKSLVLKTPCHISLAIARSERLLATLCVIGALCVSYNANADGGGLKGEEAVKAVKIAFDAKQDTQPLRSLWDPEKENGERALQSATILKLDAGLPETSALAIQKIWRAMLLGVRESPKSNEILVEGNR